MACWATMSDICWKIATSWYQNENLESPWGQLCRQWRHLRLSWRQPPVPPATTKLTSCQRSVFLAVCFNTYSCRYQCCSFCQHHPSPYCSSPTAQWTSIAANLDNAALISSGIGTPDLGAVAQISWNLVPQNILFICPIVLKLCTEHGSITAVLCANLLMIGRLRSKLWANEISRDLSWRWIFGVISSVATGQRC